MWYPGRRKGRLGRRPGKSFVVFSFLRSRHLFFHRIDTSRDGVFEGIRDPLDYERIARNADLDLRLLGSKIL